MRSIMASGQWTEPQKRWLKRIGEQARREFPQVIPPIAA